MLVGEKQLGDRHSLHGRASNRSGLLGARAAAVSGGERARAHRGRRVEVGARVRVPVRVGVVVVMMVDGRRGAGVRVGVRFRVGPGMYVYPCMRGRVGRGGVCGDVHECLCRHVHVDDRVLRYVGQRSVATDRSRYYGVQGRMALSVVDCNSPFRVERELSGLASLGPLVLRTCSSRRDAGSRP